MASIKLITLLTLLDGIIDFSETASESSPSLFPGKYERESKIGNQEFLDVLLTMGYAKEKADIMANSQVTLTIKDNLDQSYTINTNCTTRNQTLIVTPGKEFEYKLMDGRTNKGIVKVDGNIVTGVNKLGDIEVKSESVFSKGGMKTTVHVMGKSTTCNWKRISPLKQ